MSNAKRTGFMQVTPTRVVVRERSDEEKVYENPTVLMADFGLRVKSDDSLKRKDLVVNYKDKDKIKKLGAKWDFNKKCWYIQYKEETVLKNFSNYISI